MRGQISQNRSVCAEQIFEIKIISELQKQKQKLQGAP